MADEWIELTTMGSHHQQQYNPRSKRWRHRLLTRFDGFLSRIDEHGPWIDGPAPD